MSDISEAGDAAPQTVTLAASDRRTIILYAGVMIVMLDFINPSVGLFYIPLSFLMKNKLHLSANGLAEFGLLASIPGYFCFAFGAIRDMWSPFKLGDRGYFILFGALAAASFVAFAFVNVSETMLLATAMVAGFSYLFLWAAWNGLASTIGQQRAMTGQMSAVWNFAGTSAIVAALATGGILSERLEPLSANAAVRTLYFIVAGLMLAISLLGLWKPKAVFAGLRNEKIRSHDAVANLLRLVRHWPIYPALLIWLLWNFSPGTSTVLQYYMSNTLHATDAQWGEYNAISFAAAVPTFALFGILSRKYTLSTLLWWGSAIGTTQMIPLLFVHSTSAVLIAAVFVGLLGGIATAAYMDLLIRACPKGLEGTMMMTSWSMYSIAVAVGNFWGTDLYDHHGGFLTCVIATTFVYAAILPLILLIPRKLITSADGQVLPD